jgi:hypothetical protein
MVKVKSKKFGYSYECVIYDVVTVALGLRPRQGLAKVWVENETWESHFMFWEYERMKPHTSKWTPTFGIGVPMKSQIFKEQFQRSKLIILKKFLYHWKYFEM